MALRQTWLDSFDWRLHRRGWTLLHEAAEGARSASLTLEPRSDPGHDPAETGSASRHGTPSRPSPVVAYLEGPGIPRLPTDLPEGRIRDTIAGVLGGRCLVAQAAASATRQPLRILNADGKTVAWVMVESTSLPDGHPLGSRARVVEVRGYPGAAREAAHVLGASIGLAADGGALAAALAAAGRVAGDYSSRLNVALRAGDDFDAAVRALLAHLLRTVEVNHAGACANLDPEFLHDIRVATRRARSLLGEVTGFLDESPVAPGQLRAELAWLAGATGPTRDLDVWLVTLDEALDEARSQARAGNAALVDALGRLRALIDQRRSAAHLSLVDQLGSERFGALVDRWRHASDAAPLQRIDQQVGPVAAELVRRAQRRVLRRGAAIEPDSPDEALHELRKAAKRLRYLLEAFESLCPGQLVAKVVDELKALQDNLGELQDCAVQADALFRLARELGDGLSPAPEALVAIGYLTAGLAGRRLAAREDFSRRFARWERRANRRLVDDLVSALAASSRTQKASARPTGGAPG